MAYKDKELSAISTITSILGMFEYREKRRILDYVASRIEHMEADYLRRLRRPVGMDLSHNEADQREFQDKDAKPFAGIGQGTAL